MTFDFDSVLQAFPRLTVLCIGDVMLDEFVYGDVARISPEAPAPVIAVGRSVRNVGGAGNVARNVAALGARCIFIGVIGDDDAGRVLRDDIAAEPGIEAILLRDGARMTTRKTRFVSDHFSTHLLRADWESPAPLSPVMEREAILAIAGAIATSDIVLLSDYAKGVLTPAVVRAAIDGARAQGKPVVVDPKSLDVSTYRGATVLTPNLKEFVAATRTPADTLTEIRNGARALMMDAQCAAILVTRSERGMTLIAGDAEPIHVPAHSVKVRDVSGAGDTVAAALALALAAKADWDGALRLANAAAAVAVGKVGTATVSADEVRRVALPDSTRASEEKIVRSLDALDACVAAWRAEGQRVGFTNGCFDLLHPGHVKVLTAARAACDRLIVGLNSDASVRRLKGATRPLQDEHARADVLAALEAVDCIVVFGEDTPLDLIARIKPRLLVKGGDYTRENVVGHEIVEAEGGEVILVDTMPGHSTTTLVAAARGGGA